MASRCVNPLVAGRTFDCASCGILVYLAYPAPPVAPGARCVECNFLLTIEDPAVRQRVARMLHRDLVDCQESL